MQQISTELQHHRACEYGYSVWTLSHFLCKKVIIDCLQLLSKPSDQFLFVIIPLAFAFREDFTVKELTVDRSKKAFMECYFLVRTKKRQQKLSKLKCGLYFWFLH